jgi:cytochrome c2
MKIVKWVSSLMFLVAFIACSKDNNTNDTSSLYVPTSSDTTVNATLAELQQGRTLFINNCGACHSLYSPDSYSVSQWKNIISQMAPRTSMTSSQVTLVTKYVCKGKQ